MKIIKNKRGDEGSAYMMTSKWALYMILAIVIPLLGMLFAMFVTGYQVQSNSYLGDSENIVIQSRFFNSPSCFAYKDDVTGRNYPGIIDQNKFTQQRMDLCYDVPKDYTSGCFRLELQNTDTSQKIGTVESKNYGTCIMQAGIKKVPYYVLIRSNDQISSGIMYMESR